MIEFFHEVWASRHSKIAIIDDHASCTYGQLVEKIERFRQSIRATGVMAGSVVALHADFSADSIAAFLALTEEHLITIPLSSSSPARHELLYEIGQVEWALQPNAPTAEFRRVAEYPTRHELYRNLTHNNSAGLVLFTSGTTGEPKGAVHDLNRLFLKFRTRRKDFVTLAFLLLDHIGGIDTLLYVLSNGSTLVTTMHRDPEVVAEIVQRHHVEVLPVTPTFLNLLLLSESYQRYDLSSLQVITYGSEVMPQATLMRCHEVFPKVTLLQKYGTTEIGTLRSHSESQESTWVKIGGEGYHYRVVDGMLEIRAESAMLGYLNAPSPFTTDGWFMTGDLVEQNGEYLRFLGRKSDIINVGGRKVFPSEVEQVILQIENIAEVVVHSERNAIFGEVVAASVRLRTTEPKEEVRRRIREQCRKKLEPYKVPVRIEVVENITHSGRLKTIRPAQISESAGE
jgi:acyl-coenzyme A synthetase/AMP-(fatty) acid ligase